MTTTIDTQHQDNLDFVMKSLQNKPETTELFKNIIEFNSNNLQTAKVVFPTVQTNANEFYNEHKKTIVGLYLDNEELMEHVRDINR
jgi:hypothetical protein